MINYGIVRGDSRPQEIEVTPAMVFVASNIEPFTAVIDGHETSGYQYNYIGYTKDEYIQVLSSTDNARIQQLEEELRATKILLGVD